MVSVARINMWFSRDHQHASSAGSAVIGAVGGGGGASHRLHVKRQN